MPISNELVLNDAKSRARHRIGRTVADYRIRKGQVLTQDKLAESIGLNRTDIAHLEEGRELPESAALSRICEKLEIPPIKWLAATHAFYVEGYIFHELICELIGRRIPASDHAPSDQLIALDRAQALFKGKHTPIQVHSQVNSLLVFYGERPITLEFFERYLGVDAFASNSEFLNRLRRFQAEAMRLYGNFRRAFTCMSRTSDLKAELRPIDARPTDAFKQRTSFAAIREISPDRLADLGYIAAERITSQNRDRHELGEWLGTLAEEVDKKGVAAINDVPPRTLARMRSLARKLESQVQLESTLFSQIDADTLRAESTRLMPAAADLTRIRRTQDAGIHNLGVYLSEPHMDVYVATSMREDADFQSVNTFVRSLFAHKSVKDLNLRYFNPTQSWIEDRVSKGLVEALMLRRAAVTVYMAQKGDTFGKDSEASVALGQGKTVIVYVPRLFDQDLRIDSESLFRLDSKKLDERLEALKLEKDDVLDTREKARSLLRKELEHLSNEQFNQLVFGHWPDFDLQAECRTITNDHLKSAACKWLHGISTAESADASGRVSLESTVRGEVTEKLVAVADRFEARAKLFRDTHPLSLQVIVRSGVLNGILVTRSVEDCARLLRGVLANDLEFDVEVDESNYRLIERGTRSTIRVVSRHRLLTFAFWSQYFDPENYSLPPHELPAGIL